MNRFRFDFEEDMRYQSEKELRDNLAYAVKNGTMSEETAKELLEDKAKGFEWLFRSEK